MSERVTNYDTIRRVKCDVVNCIHNNHARCCTANEIKVGPQAASTCAETVCQSFSKQQH